MRRRQIIINEEQDPFHAKEEAKFNITLSDFISSVYLFLYLYMLPSIVAMPSSKLRTHCSALYGFNGPGETVHDPFSFFFPTYSQPPSRPANALTAIPMALVLTRTRMLSSFSQTPYPMQFLKTPKPGSIFDSYLRLMG
jgi:hypothetical protein